jgi:SAM-dependent methyltransferase
MKTSVFMSALRELKAYPLRFFRKVSSCKTVGGEDSFIRESVIANKSACDWLINDLGTYKIEVLHAMTELRHEILTTLLASRYSLASRMNPSQYPAIQAPRLDPSRAINIESMRRRLKEIAPLNYDMFITALDVGTQSYQALPATSCSTESHPQSILFRQFLVSYLQGAVLDVGCGPQPIPSYLSGHPVDLIYGIDPISSAADHPFSFYSGFGEFLPWRDESFDTVISATTLDHYYLLDKGLEEVARVLKPRGFFVAWITEFPDALLPYNPYVKLDRSYDDEHLFHINRKWFIPYAKEKGLELVECLSFDIPFRYLFMAFQKA